MRNDFAYHSPQRPWFEIKSQPASPSFTISPRVVVRKRSVSDRLWEQLSCLGFNQAELMSQTQTPWASITFSGARHSFTMIFRGGVAIAAGEHFIAELGEHEFAIAGHLVADAQITEVQHTASQHTGGQDATLVVTCEILLLKD